jgi:hypothetical protein
MRRSGPYDIVRLGQAFNELVEQVWMSDDFVGHFIGPAIRLEVATG